MRGLCLAGPLPGPPARPRPSPGPGFRFCFLLFSAPALPSCHARCQPGLQVSQCRSHGAAAAAGRAACQCQTDRRRRRVLSRRPRQFITNRTLHANKVHGWRPVTRIFTSGKPEGLLRRGRGGGGEGRPGEDEERSGSAEAWRAGRLKVERKRKPGICLKSIGRGLAPSAKPPRCCDV